MRSRPLGALPCLVVGLAVAAASLVHPGAARADQGLVSGLRVHDGQLDITLAPTALPPGVRPAQADVRVLVDGRPAATAVTGVAGATGPTRLRTVVLALDTSGSMAGGRLQSAEQAVGQVLAELPADVRVGLVRFAGSVVVGAAPTTDRAQVRRAVSGLRAGGRTQLYDAVTTAVRAAGTVGERRVMVLSDGRDDGSRTTLQQAVAAVRRSGTQVDVVDASGDGSATAALRPLAAASHGRAVSVSSTGLATAFHQVAQSWSSRLTLLTGLPAGVQGRTVRVTVELVAAGGRLRQVREVAVPGATTPSVAAPRRLPRGEALWATLAAVFLASLLLVGLALTAGASGARRRTRRALSSYTLAPSAVPAAAADPSRLGSGALATSAVDLADRAVERRGSADRLALALDRAGLRWRPAEWLVIWTASVVVGTVLAPALLGSTLVNVVLGATGGWFAPRTYLRRKADKRRRAFQESLPDALQLLAASLATGYSLAQAVDAVVEEGSQPMAGELGRALAEARIGRPLEDALEAVAERMDCEDFRWVVMAVRVQREVGGNLSEVLTRVCGTMRERASLRRQVRALSAEGRVSAYVLVALPLSMAAFMLSFRRDYFRPLYTEPVGLVALGATAVMLLLGMVWLNKLVKVEM